MELTKEILMSILPVVIGFIVGIALYEIEMRKSKRKKLKKCPACGSDNLKAVANEKTTAKYKGYKEITIYNVSGQKCSACGELWLDGRELKRIGELESKEKSYQDAKKRWDEERKSK